MPRATMVGARRVMAIELDKSFISRNDPTS